jgi:hypothetical protein
MVTYREAAEAAAQADSVAGAAQLAIDQPTASQAGSTSTALALLALRLEVRAGALRMDAAIDRAVALIEAHR